MLDSSLRSGILDSYGFEMTTCYFKAPTVEIMKFLKMVNLWDQFLFDFAQFIGIKKFGVKLYFHKILKLS